MEWHGPHLTTQYNPGMRIRAIWTLALVACASGLVAAQGQAPRQVSLVVTNGVVVTMDAAGRVIQNGGVAIDGAEIVAVDTADAIAHRGVLAEGVRFIQKPFTADALGAAVRAALDAA